MLNQLFALRPDEKNRVFGLDVLRAIAVLTVVDAHAAGAMGQYAGTNPLHQIIPDGVELFFVLSGFLITRILINSKLQDETLQRGPGHSLKTFFIRRNLRIWPVYYLTIFGLAVVNFQAVRMAFWWLVTYTQNIWIVVNQTWLGAIDHLWSLAVEEQYYIFFPLDRKSVV